MRRLAAAAFAALVLAPAAAAATPTAPVYDGKGHVIRTPFAPPPAKPILTAPRATKIFFADGKVAGWLARYPRKSWVWSTTFDRKARSWKVQVWSGKAGEIA